MDGDPKTGYYATGALALWKNSDETQTLIIAGIQGSLFNTTASYPNGYVEFVWKADGTVDRNNTDNMMSVYDDSYTATIGKHPINHLFQAEDGIFFASTQAHGLWSYRNRVENGGWQWNYEE
jgi:hypothetical protein